MLCSPKYREEFLEGDLQEGFLPALSSSMDASLGFSASLFLLNIQAMENPANDVEDDPMKKIEQFSFRDRT